MNESIKKFKINHSNLNNNYLFFLILLFPFLISAYRTIELEAFKSDMIFRNIYGFLFLSDNSLIILSWNIIWKLTILILIIFAISLFEFNIKKKLRNSSYSFLSLSRIKKSDGHKFADVWYLIISLIDFQLLLRVINNSIAQLFNESVD